MREQHRAREERARELGLARGGAPRGGDDGRACVDPERRPAQAPEGIAARVVVREDGRRLPLAGHEDGAAGQTAPQAHEARRGRLAVRLLQHAREDLQHREVASLRLDRAREGDRGLRELELGARELGERAAVGLPRDGHAEVGHRPSHARERLRQLARARSSEAIVGEERAQRGAPPARVRVQERHAHLVGRELELGAAEREEQGVDPRLLALLLRELREHLGGVRGQILVHHATGEAHHALVVLVAAHVVAAEGVLEARVLIFTATAPSTSERVSWSRSPRLKNAR
ncbi:MAG: hypothetical protein M5U28_33275 [Sandaracinaceae bacterium]|nr:hypothetical protein [Sandaracinaceae bacterium]